MTMDHVEWTLVGKKGDYSDGQLFVSLAILVDVGVWSFITLHSESLMSANSVPRAGH